METAASEMAALAERAGQLLVTRGLSLALAESCTGGLIGSLITDVPGSSAYFLGSAVTYADRAKSRILGVSEEVLQAHGAVSAVVAEAMARGARLLFGADVAASVTGIAGPGGATAGKPVGLTYIHLSAPETEIGERHTWCGNRAGNKQASAAAVLRLIIRCLEDGAAAGHASPST